METHHDHFEWASQFGLDLNLVTKDFPDLTDRNKLAEWVDSESNMLVLCDAHHRGRRVGIHSITYPIWLLQRYQGPGWTFVEQIPLGHRAKVPLFANGDPTPEGPKAYEVVERD